MGVLRRLFWLMLGVAVIAVGVYCTAQFGVADRLTGWFLALQPWLPLTLDFDQFLVVLTVAGFLIVALVLILYAATIVNFTTLQQKEQAKSAAAKREIVYIKEQHQRQHEQLRLLGQTLTKRLDKRILVQAVVEAASRLTSVSQTNGIVSCWLLNFETDTIRFELGHYADETMFTQTEFQQTEWPFSQVIAAQKPWVAAEGTGGRPFVKPEKQQQLGSATSMLVVPFIVENSVVGILVIFCHPDVLKSYEEQKLFYDAIWGELTLALAIAIQGEVAILDRLTGVHNREYFLKRLIQEIERANRFQLPLSLLMIDIDNFKLVNDMLGHPQGDAVLKIIAKLIRKEIRVIDLAGRYGGEEFIILLPETGYGENMASNAGVMAVAERIRKAVDGEFSGLQKPLNLTISIGVAVRRFPEDREMDYRELIRIADEQLYRAKTAGKNRVCAFIPDNPQPVP